VGVVGGWIQQLGDDTGPLAMLLDGAKGYSVDLGPMVTWSGKIGRTPVSANLRFEFMKRLIRQSTRKVYLIVDGHPVHRSVAVRKWVAVNAERRRLIRLPGYCPELNPDELFNQDVKTNAPGKSRPANKAELIGAGRRHLRRRRKEPLVIRSLFKNKHVRLRTL
jgi:hypothetical protein